MNESISKSTSSCNQLKKSTYVIIRMQYHFCKMQSWFYNIMGLSLWEESLSHRDDSLASWWHAFEHCRITSSSYNGVIIYIIILASIIHNSYQHLYIAQLFTCYSSCSWINLSTGTSVRQDLKMQQNTSIISLRPAYSQTPLNNQYKPLCCASLKMKYLSFFLPLNVWIGKLFCFCQ